MTVEKIETVQELIEEMEGEGTQVGSAWEFTNRMNNKKLFAVFPASQRCDIHESPSVKDPKQIWADGKYIGSYELLNQGNGCSCEEGMSPKALSYEEIQIKEREVKNLKGLWLSNLGWEHICDFVDGGWRWCKLVEGKMMMCDMMEAINIEYNFIEEPK